jgi:hypothetical protein
MRRSNRTKSGRGAPLKEDRNAQEMHTSDFYYDLPKELIAQTPIPNRASSRLLVYNRPTVRFRTAFSHRSRSFSARTTCSCATTRA